jgi:hypothetical protein
MLPLQRRTVAPHHLDWRNGGRATLHATETFDVVILGFDDREERPEERLQRAFGIDLTTAQALLSGLPATVQRAVSRVRAEYFRRALTMIGAQAEVRDQNGATIAPEPEPAPAAALTDAAAFEAFAEPAQHGGSIAFDTTGRAPSPWRADPAAVDPMSQTMAMIAPPADMPPPIPEPTALGVRSIAPAGAVLRGPAHATVHEAPAARNANPRTARPVATATVIDARPPSRAPQAEPAPYAVTERPTTERAFAAVNPQAVSRGDAPAWQRPAAIAASPAAGPPLAAPGMPTLGAAGWSNAAALATSAAVAVARAATSSTEAATPAATPALVTNMPSGVFDPPHEDARGHDEHGLPRIFAPRDPSSVFDPAPGAGNDSGQRTPVASAGMPDAPSAALPDFGFVSIERSASGAAGGFDLGPALDHAPVQAPQSAALTLDSDVNTAALRVLSPWEQPSTRSMAEPPGPALAAEALGAQRPARARAARSPAAGGRAAEPAGQRARAARPGGRSDSDERESPARRAAHGAKPGARARGATDRGAEVAAPANADTRSFWETIGEALALPFSGTGPYWIGAITAWSAAVAVLGFFASPMLLLGAVVMFFANTSVLAFACDYYRVCMWAPAVGEDTLDRSPDFDPVRLLNGYMKSGMHLMLFLIVSQIPLIAWVGMSAAEDGIEVLPELALHPLTWLLFLFPYFYWPMGVALTALHNDFAAVWNLPAGLRAISRAPAEYTLIVGIGMLTFAAAAVALFVLSSALGITGVVISGTLGFPLAVSHGIQGALMGHLLRARGEIFEQP